MPIAHTYSRDQLQNGMSGLWSSPKAVRVCFLIDRLDTAGTETQLLALIRNLDRAKVEPYLALLDGEDERSRILEPADCPPLRLGVNKLLSPSTVAPLRVFARFLKTERIDVLQLYFPDSNYFGVLAGRLAGVKAIVRTRNNVNHWMTPTHRLLGRLLNRFVTVTVCNSEAGRQAVLADERPDPDSVLVIENGVDMERFAHIPPVSPEPDPHRPRRVGMVANLRQVKGVDLLVRAAALVVQGHPDVEFHVAGEGPCRPELERLIDELELRHRFFLRGQTQDVPGFLATLDIAVLSSRSEGMPNAVLEYMASGRPMVVSRVGGVPQLLDDSTAWFVPPGDHESLARGITGLLKDQVLCADMARNARERALTRYSRARATSEFQLFFKTLRETKEPSRR